MRRFLLSALEVVLVPSTKVSGTVQGAVGLVWPKVWIEFRKGESWIWQPVKYDGTFEIGLQPGDYQVVAWAGDLGGHESCTDSTTVRVTEQRLERLKLDLCR